MESKKILTEISNFDVKHNGEAPVSALLTHMKVWFMIREAEQERIDRASFFARYGPERPQ